MRENGGSPPSTARTLVALGCYYCLLIGGLSSMLIEELGWVSFATYVVAMPAGALLLWRVVSGHFRGIGLGRYDRWRQHLLAGTFGGAASVGLVFAIMVAASWVSAVTARTTFSGFLTGIVIQQLVVAGIEELTFRGTIQRILSDRLGSGYGLMGASILFGLFHVPNILYQEVPGRLIPIAVGALTLMGIVFGWAFLRTSRRLVLPIALHAGWNIAAFGIEDGLSAHYTGPDWLTGTTAWFPETGLLSIIGLISVTFLIIKLTKPTNEHAYNDDR